MPRVVGSCWLQGRADADSATCQSRKGTPRRQQEAREGTAAKGLWSGARQKPRGPLCGDVALQGVRVSGHAAIEAQNGKGHPSVWLLSGLGRRPGLLSERKCSPDRFHPLALLLGLPTGSVLRNIHLRVFTERAAGRSSWGAGAVDGQPAGKQSAPRQPCPGQFSGGFLGTTGEQSPQGWILNPRLRPWLWACPGQAGGGEVRPKSLSPVGSPPSRHLPAQSIPRAPSSDEECFFDLLSKFQSSRMDDQRCPLEEGQPAAAEATAAPTLEERIGEPAGAGAGPLPLLQCSEGGADQLRSAPCHREPHVPALPKAASRETCNHPTLRNTPSQPSLTASPQTEEFFDLIASSQSRRLDDQRASVGSLPGLRITHNNLGHLRGDGDPQEPGDEFFNMLIKCQVGLQPGAAGGSATLVPPVPQPLGPG
ncbi:hypothetical protein J1605_017273 [Eschrichtius robustus]|uniref:G-protein-signaling modulator 1 n=1 Tax=Eschrichtius robustus TaxID=9764 RepID=A0AB34I391_ESCRO|nr:hypothetical protein J1605_017273 [Eschrichtius robustus]